MINDLELSELIAVKLCHDLSGPIGAINNGTELLKDAGDGLYEQSLELVEGSAKDAVARILLYRQAYGSINSSAQVPLQSLKRLIEDCYNSGKVNVEWKGELAGEVQPESICAIFGKAVLNLIIITAKTMVYGGKISVLPEIHNGKHKCVIKGEGKSIKISEDYLEILKHDVTKLKIDVKNVQPYLVRRLLNEVKANIDISVKEDELEIVIVQ